MPQLSVVQFTRNYFKCAVEHRHSVCDSRLQGPTSHDEMSPRVVCAHDHHLLALQCIDMRQEPRLWTGIMCVNVVHRLQAQLDALDQKAALKVVTSKVSMAAINQRNKAANFNVTIRNLGTAPAGATQRKGGVDPFSRRVTRPNIYWSTGNSGKAGNTQNGDANGNAAQKPEDLEPPTAVKLKHGQTRMDPVKLVQELALDIDVSQLQNVSIVPPLHLKVLGPRWHHSLAHYSQADLSGRTLLTVADWQARAGGAGADE